MILQEKPEKKTSGWTLCCYISGNIFYIAYVMHTKKLHLVSCTDNWLCSPLFLFKTGCTMQLLEKLHIHTHRHSHTGFFITPQIFLNKSCCLDLKLFFSLQHENCLALGSAAFHGSVIEKFSKSISGFVLFFHLFLPFPHPPSGFSAFLTLVCILLIPGKA